MRMFGRCRAKKHCPALAQATPLAPELGLFLDECFFEAYNDRWGSNRAATVRLSAFQEQMDAFKVGWDNCPYLIHSQVARLLFNRSMRLPGIRVDVPFTPCSTACMSSVILSQRRKLGHLLWSACDTACVSVTGHAAVTVPLFDTLAHVCSVTRSTRTLPRTMPSTPPLPCGRAASPTLHTTSLPGVMRPWRR